MNQQVSNVINSYPKEIQPKIKNLQQLILAVAKENNIKLDETLKWNEPSYLTKNGSTVRIAWNKSNPNQYGIYFNCRTTLIETFKEIYPSDFNYDGNRAILFNQTGSIDKSKLKQCILLSLTYHKIKHLPMLGL